MANPNWSLVSFNGFNVQSGALGFRAYFVWGEWPLVTRQMDVIEATVTGRAPSFVRAQPKAITTRLMVKLTAGDEATTQTVLQVFDENAGLVYITATDADGTGTTYRAAVQVIGLERVAGTYNRWQVFLRVPNPVWEANTATTDTRANLTAATTAFTLNNTGNRRCRPQVQIDHDAVKPLDPTLYYDYALSFEGFIVSRQPLPGLMPVYLFDQAGNPARISTAALVKTATTTTLSGAHTSAQTTINVASAAAFPAVGMGYITDGATNDEQIAWTGKTATTLTGVTRGIGGTTAASHSGGQTIAVSQALANGDDCRVWIDDVEVKRWLVPAAGTTWANSTASDVVVNISMPPAQKLTLARTNMTLTDPPDGGSISVNEDIGAIPQSGFIATPSNYEVIYYNGTDPATRQLLNIKRAVWGTTVATHTVGASSGVFYLNPMRYVVAIGNASASQPPSPANERPCIQLPASSNLLWRWGNETDDPNTVFFDRDNPSRTAQWSPGLELDGNDIVPLTQISQSKTALTFKDDAPGDGSPPYNYAEIVLPQGIQTGVVNAINCDWSVSNIIFMLEMHVADAGGRYKLVTSNMTSGGNKDLPTGKQLTADGYALKLKGRYAPTTGIDVEGAGTDIDNTGFTPPATGMLAQRFTLDQPTAIRSIQVRLALKTAGPSVVVRGGIYRDASNAPDVLGGRYMGIGDHTVSSTTPAVFTNSFQGQVLPAGTYWLLLYRTSTSAIPLWNGQGAGFFPRGIATRYNGTSWGVKDDWNFCFNINGNYANDGRAPIQADQPPPVRSSLTAGFDNLTVRFDTNQTPFVHRISGFGQNLVHESGTYTNTTTGKSVTFDKWMKPTTVQSDAKLVVDFEAGTVLYTEQGITYSVPGVMTTDGTNEPMYLNPGNNSMTFTEQGLADCDLVTTFRPARV
jgi:hypothetical protein